MVVGSHPIRREGGGVGNIDPIHNFGTHFLCTKGYGILGEKGGGQFHIFGPLFWSVFGRFCISLFCF